MPRRLNAIVTPLLLPAILIATGCTGLSTHPATRVESSSDEELRPDSPIEAAMFRYTQRLSADGTIPDNALLTALAQREEMLAASGERTSSSAAEAALNWDWLGPGNIGGRVREILIHPTQPDIMWTGGASGGVWKTTDAGATWQPMSDFVATLAVGCMALHPTDPDTLYVGTGEGFFNTVGGTSNLSAVRGAGIFRSTDGGSSWNHMPSTNGFDFEFVNRLAIDPANPSIIFAATSTGIFRSADAGDTWSQRSTAFTFDIRIDPHNPANMVAGTRGGAPLFSTDAGLTWQPATGITGIRSELRYAPSTPGTVYASLTDATTGRIFIYTSTDGGQSYTLTTINNGFGTYAAYNNVLWVDPTDANILIMGSIPIYRSADAGATFAVQYQTIHPDIHAITPHPDYDGVTNRTVFIGCDGGVYRIDDILVNSAVELNNNLGITQFYGAAVSPSGIILAGAQDNGTLRFTGGTETWTNVVGGDGGFCAADPSDPNFLYGEIQRLRIRRSGNGGLSFGEIIGGLTDANSLNTNFIPYFMLDPNDPNRMLAAAIRLWRSDNVKSRPPTWTSIKPATQAAPGAPPAHFAADNPLNISTIAVALGNSDAVWVGHNNGQVFKSADGTAPIPNWTRLDDNGVRLPDRWISTIVIDPNDHDTVYLALMGWENDSLWKTSDGGLSWTDISGSGAHALPSAPASALAVDFSRPGHLYVGTDVGMFVSTDDGTTWSVVTQGPGTVPVEQLLWKDATTLVAVTHGRGLFEADISQPLFIGLATAPADPTAPGVDPPLAVDVTAGVQAVVPASVRAMVSDGIGGFTPIPMNASGGDRFAINLPAAQCGPAIEYYVEAMGDGGALETLPIGAPTNLFSYRVGSSSNVFHDNFENNTGWSTEILGATSGQWQRGVPVNDPNWIYDPISDSDGSGQCFLTQNQLGNTDVDNGAVRLTSPNLDMSGGDVTVNYDFYLYLNTLAGEDLLLTEVSSSGPAGPWTTIAKHLSNNGLGWRSHTITSDDFAAARVNLTDTMRLRFTANDANTQSLVEAGIDAFDVSIVTCGPTCYVDCDQSTGAGILDIFDFLCFQNSFVSAGVYACECDTSTGPGVCDIFDFLCFQNAFVAGCP